MNEMNSTEQRPIDDAALSAWLDGALDADTMAQVSDALEQRPELQQRITAMLCNDRKLQQHYAQMALPPAPAALQGLLQADSKSQPHFDAEQAGHARGHQSTWHERLYSLLDGLLPRPMLAATAMLMALAVGLIVGQQTGQSGAAANTQPKLVMSGFQQAHPLQDLLESATAGAYRQLDEHTSAVVDMTFQHSNGDYCRQFRVYDSSLERGNIAVACRQQQAWQLQLVQTSSRAPVTGAHYQAANGPETALIDRFIMDHQLGDVMVGDGERDLIERGWRTVDQQ
jgi:anti-sigma factor RsiW